MTIDTTKPLEVVANWDSSLVWPVKLEVDEQGYIHVSWAEGAWCMFDEDGAEQYGNLTLRNAKEPSELTWETCPQWAKDEAARVWTGDAFLDIYPMPEVVCEGFKHHALLIAKHEEQPTEPVDPALVAAREWYATECTQGNADWIHEGNADDCGPVKSFIAGFQRALKDQTP